MTEWAYYVETDDDNQPVRLYRGHRGTVQVWRGGKWEASTRWQPELDGLGGSADYVRIDAADLDRWQATLNG